MKPLIKINVRQGYLRCSSCGAGMLTKHGSVYSCGSCDSVRELVTVQSGELVRIGWIKPEE